MIDFIKIEIVNPTIIQKIMDNYLLIFDRETERANHQTGTLFYTKYYTYNKLNFTIYFDDSGKASKLYISGSLHYYFNGGNHNANDFTYINLLEVIADLKRKFNINPYECKIRSLEYGVNIKPAKYRTRSILQNTFYHQRKKFTEPINKPYKQSGNTRQNDFLIKIYDKAYQFPNFTDGEILRFEVKYCRMRKLREIGIDNLSDLLVKENLLNLFKIMLTRFKQILMYDFTINIKKLTSTKRINCNNYANSNYWENIIIGIKENRLNIKNFDYHKKRLKKIITEYSDNVQKQLTEIIKQKQLKLLNLPSYNWTYCSKNRHYNTTITLNNCTPYTHLYIGGIKPESYKLFSKKIKPKKGKVCLVTGLDISMQKESKLLSNTGLKFHEINNPDIFMKLTNTLLTGEDNKYEKSIYEKISKQIRNRYYNNKDKYSTNQTVLFER